jgi:Leucine-rich repeat (LRR) protein
VASEKERNMYIVWFVLSLLLCFGTVFFADDEPSGGALATGMIHVLVAVGFWVAYVHSGGESHERSFFVVLTVLGLVLVAAVSDGDTYSAVGILVNLCIFIAGAALWGSYNHGHPVVNPYHCPQGYLDQNGTCVPPPTPAPTPSPTPPVLPTPPPAPPLIKTCTGASTGLHPNECEAWQALDYTLAGLVASSCSATDPCGCPTNASVFASCSPGPDGNVTHITAIRLAAPSGTQIYNTSAINPEQRAWDNFPQLTSLALHGNSLGQLVQQPSSLGPMNDLQSLVMNDLMISSIPHWIANVPTLSTLDLGSNALSDDVPWDGVLCKLASLTRLVLSNNKIRGSVPRCIGQLNRLVELDLGTNDFNGTIPSEIGNLTALAMLDVSANGMDGTIPFEVLRSLTTLRASDNRFSGPISWGSLNPSLRELVLHGNSLVGTIASSVDKLTELAVLDLGSNDMQGMVPWFALTSAGSIRGLRLQGNTFGGAVPKVTNKQDNLWFNMTACTNTGDAAGQDPTAPCCDISGNTFTFAWSKDSKVYVESHCDAAQIQHFAHSYSAGLVAVSLSFLGLWLLLDMVRLFKGQRKRSLSAMKIAELHEKGGAYENMAAFVQKSGCAQLYDSLVHVVKTPGFLALFVLYWIIWIPVSQRFGRGVEAPADFVENPASFCNTFHYAPTMYARSLATSSFSSSTCSLTPPLLVYTHSSTCCNTPGTTSWS